MPKILAIDDNQDNLVSISVLLRKLILDCTVITSDSGAEGIKKAEAEQPDTILLDVKMPEMDGFEVCRRLKSSEKTKHIPVVMLTAIKTDVESRVKGLGLGADAFLFKPIDEAELAAQIKVMLRIKTAEDLLQKEKDLLEDTVLERTKALRESERHLRISSQINNIFLTYPDEKMYEEVLKVILKVMESGYGTFGYFAEDGSFVAPAVSRDIYWEKCNVPEKELIFQKGTFGGIWATAIKEKKPLLSNDGPFNTPEGHIPIENTMVTPIIFHDEIISAIHIANKPDGYDEEDRVILKTIADQIAPVLYARLERDKQDRERKQVEDKLRESEEKFSKLFHANPVYTVFTTFEDGRFLEVNEAFVKITGYRREEVIGRTTTGIGLWANPGERVKLVKLAKEKGRFRDQRVEFLKKNGELLIMLWSAERTEIDGEDCFISALVDITDIENAQMALRESEARFVLFMDHYPGIAFMKDLKGRLVYVNKAYKRRWGHKKKEDWYGKTNEQLWPPETATSFNKGDQEVLSKGHSMEFIESLPYPDGQFHTQMTTKFPVLKDHEPAYLGGIGLDITDLRRTETALLESEEKYRTILESIEEAYFEVDIVGNFTFFNDSLSKILGYSNDELAGMNNRDYMPPESSNKIYDLFNQIYNTGNPIKKVVYEIIRKDGGHGFHELSASLMKDQTGRPIGFRGIAHDITDLKKAQDTLRESEEKHRTILESIEDGYYELDTTGNFTFCNDSMCRILGYPNDELMGMNNREYMDQETAKDVYQKFNRVYATGKADKGLQYELTRKDEVKIYVETSVSLMKDEEDKPIGFRGILRDITERKRAGQEKRRLEAKLQQAQKMEAIGTLAGGVAHDLNNILGGLVSYPELLLLQLPEDSPFRKPILTIQKSGEKAAAVVQDLLTLARRGVVTTEAVSLNDVISEYLKSPECEKLQSYHPGVHIESHLEKDALNILGSSIHLSKTVMNLVSNAAEAMPEGGKLTVSTENRHIDRPIRGYDDIKEGYYVVLTVSDTGMGISPDDIEKIFEPFYTKKKMGRSGTGLGMAVVWGTVKDHNGYLDIQSTEGKGTTFTLYFPVTRKNLPEDKSHFAIETYSGNGESILVIDDVEEQRQIASGMLKELGYSVVSVSSGEEAVVYLKANKVDLLVLDMIMDPGMDGLDTYKKVLEIHPEQKAIIASGFSGTDRVKKVQRLGAGTYIKKPFLLEKIGRAVKKELGK